MNQKIIIGFIISTSFCYTNGLNGSNMNGEYVIANPNYDSPHKFSTSYSSYPNVEYFDVYSPPISTR